MFHSRRFTRSLAVPLAVVCTALSATASALARPATDWAPVGRTPAELAQAPAQDVPGMRRAPLVAVERSS